MLELLYFCFSKGASGYELLMCSSQQYSAVEGWPGSNSSGAGASVVPSEPLRFAQYSKGNHTISVFSFGTSIAIHVFLSFTPFWCSACIFLDKGGGLVPHVPGQWDIIKAFTLGSKGGCVCWGGKGTGSGFYKLKDLSAEAFFLSEESFSMLPPSLPRSVRGKQGRKQFSRTYAAWTFPVHS